MKYLKKFSLNESIKLVKQEEELSPLEKEFGVKLNTSRFLGDSETFYDIYNDDEKIGYLVTSTDKYDDYNFEDLLGGKVVYLNFIKIRESGLLRETIMLLKSILLTDYDYLVLEVAGHDYNLFIELKKKWESIGFIGVIPDDIAEWDLGFLCTYL